MSVTKKTGAKKASSRKTASKTTVRKKKAAVSKKKTAKKTAATQSTAKTTASRKKTATKTPRAKKTSGTGFQVGDYVVYPMHGVGEIQAIQKQVILGKRKECYMLEIPSNNMRVMIPVENASTIGIRAIISKREVRKILDLLRKDEVDTEEDWKIRYQNNLEKIKSGDIYAVAEVCRNLYKRARDKELSLMERRLYESAYSLVTNEIAVTRGEDVEAASNLISEVLS
ncbi:MAG: transcriptional regulator [Leptospiraceae bacterium]|nr:transcriptional regulator [Leptospiraceae bacterium]